ncbi:RHS repeat domain-containing protein [Fulvivirga sediminis]|uniref:RHS repeat-associated core domain-containing protein n=1 Tax=Fulvivirga sediminis TaxID=2803949 RepID=A0A937JXY4_9BACT|nr:RHS repeat-associated core domain-containing protein [Fulvivirga sediminis]MBL3655119.1 hypothetical protein [Fulvivirga sediminis]
MRNFISRACKLLRYSHMLLIAGFAFLLSSQEVNAKKGEAWDTDTTGVVTMPKEMRLSRTGRLPTADYERSYLLSDLQEDNAYQIFEAPPCLEGEYYLTFQLEYDLGDLNTEIDWSTDMKIVLLDQPDTSWVQSARLSTVSQHFVSTVFHDSVLACNSNIQFTITDRQDTGVVAVNNVYLNILMFRKDENVFDPAVKPALNYQISSNNIFTSWSYPAYAGADEFELQWVFIGDYENFTGSSSADAFAYKEPVSVSSSGYSYQHLVYYPDGRLWFRVRAIGYNPDYPSFKILGQWSYGSGSALSIDNHESGKTWQQQTFFAEEGKYKKVMQYYDATFRSRQTLTNQSSLGITMLEETYYDYEGRESAKVMPGPVLTNSLDYTSGLNVFSPGNTEVDNRTGANRKKFHYDNGSLENSILSDLDGASRYYSPANGLALIHRNYLPDAEGFVYSQTEYTNDGTGKVNRQGGVGETFRVDGDHAVRYYYGQAAPAELIRLFGSNVGNATHYRKNLIVDANGQVSVNYETQEGQTIASALAGDPPSNVEALESYNNLDPDPVTIDLSRKNKFYGNKSEIAHKILNVSPNTNYTFSYSLSALGAELGDLGCQSCSYDLNISITDTEGHPMDLSSAAGNESLTGESYERKNISASSCTNATVVDDIDFSLLFTEIGDYTVTKTLTTRELSYEEMRNAVITNDSITTALQTIIESYTIDSAACEICTDCPEVEDAINEAIEEVSQQDCDNIYQQIIQYYDDKYGDASDAPYIVPEDSIIAHPLYCKYELCIKNKLSSIFEKQVARYADWTAASSANYTNLVDLDPFFNNTDLSGDGFKSAIQNKLNNIDIGTIPYDSTGNGVADDSTTYVGTIDQVSDPNNTNYYVDERGNPDPSNGYHILYFDLMDRRDELDDETYQQLINQQRWSLYKSFYFEAKRKTKLEIPEFQNCLAAKEELEQIEEIPETPEGLEQWGEENGIGAPVSAAELEMNISNIAFNCGTQLSQSDSTAIAGYLESYFNGHSNNFFRFIIKSDLQSSPELSAIQSILSNYNCSLDSVAQDDPIICDSDPENWIVNPGLLQNGNVNCPTSDIVASCYNGWSVATGTPNTSVGGGSGRAFLWAYPGDVTSEALRGTFVEPLEPGEKYELCLQYAVYTDNGNFDSPIVDNVYMQLSRSTRFLNAQGILAPVNTSNQSVFAQVADSTSIKSYNKSRLADVTALANCFLPQPQYIDPVIIDGSTSPNDYVWLKNNANSPVYKDTCIIFTPTQASTYFYLSIMSCTADTYQAINIKDLKVRKISPQPNGVWFEGEYVCLKYDTTSSLGAFSYTVDWDREVALCQERAAEERDRLVTYAIQDYLDEVTSSVYNDYTASCLDKIEETLDYTFEQKEYHYTLYYYDQSNQLVQTVPPKGVHPLTPAQVDAYLAGNTIEPNHSLRTFYHVNSINQAIEQEMPDAGVSKFWYNLQGQLRLSQNAQQAVEDQYSYSKYDDQGRIIEVGEIETTEDIADLTAKLDSSSIFPEALDYELSDVTKTFYDDLSPKIQSDLQQKHLRSRVSWTEKIDPLSSDTVATYYSYDSHGNVNSLIQDLPGLAIKRTDYVYDLISSKVNYLIYQFGEEDEFIHRYNYDADNRITEVYTSGDGFIWDRDAYYFYYLHGPVARLSLGQYNVQGLDYYYTLQGWLKGVNMPYEADLARDGLNGSRIGKDAFAYELGYYQGDYKPINPAVAISGERDQVWQRYNTHTSSDGLYNGNIAWMTTDLPQIGLENNDRTKGMQAMMYQYDQLHRIKAASSLSNYVDGSGFSARSGSSPYDVSYSYDANGNFNQLIRRDEQAAVSDNFQYSYYDQTNRLKNVDGSSNQNYEYDNIGNLTNDQSEGLEITWNAYGKVQQVTKSDGTVLTFSYDAGGNRISKTIDKDGHSIKIIYSLGAGGNVMAIYRNDTIIEQPIYGVGRLGMKFMRSKNGQRLLGQKSYELSNHLKNVLVVTSDNIHLLRDSSWTVMRQASDYYPFGLSMDGRSFNRNMNYRYGFNGKDHDFEISAYNFGSRIHNPRIARFLSIDPKWALSLDVTPYAFAGNSPILFIDKNGDHPIIAWLIRNFSIGVVTDVMIQASINWLLSEDGDVGQAFKDVDYLDAAWNGVTNTIKLGKKAKIALNGGYAVAKGYWKNGADYTYSDALIDFLVGGGASAIGDKLTSFIGNKGSTYVYKILKSKGLKAGHIRQILQAAGFGKNVWNWESSGMISTGAAREMRGNLIEDWLSFSVYTAKKGFRQTTYANKLVDFVSDNLSVSVKSVRSMTSSWKSSMKKHIQNLSTVNGNVTLDIRYNIKGADQSIINELKEFGENAGVEVILKPFK